MSGKPARSILKGSSFFSREVEGLNQQFNRLAMWPLACASLQGTDALGTYLCSFSERLLCKSSRFSEPSEEIAKQGMLI